MAGRGIPTAHSGPQPHPRTLPSFREGNVLAQNRSEPPRRPSFETVFPPDRVPLYDLVPVRGPGGDVLDAYRGVQRADTREVVSVVSARYGLIQHRAVAEAVHAVGQALDRPEIEAGVPSFPREQIRLYAGGRRLEVKLVVGHRFGLGEGEYFYPGLRVLNSLDG